MFYCWSKKSPYKVVNCFNEIKKVRRCYCHYCIAVIAKAKRHVRTKTPATFCVIPSSTTITKTFSKGLSLQAPLNPV